jgi:hypothetical protein
MRWFSNKMNTFTVGIKGTVYDIVVVRDFSPWIIFSGPLIAVDSHPVE